MMIRGSMKKWFMLVSLVFVMVAVLEVWGIETPSAASPSKPIKLRIMVANEPTGASPIIGGLGGFSRETEPIVYNVMEPLIDLDKKGEPIPKLATKWEQRGPTTWRFYLREGVKFHNGDNFTARDVVEVAKWLFDEKKVSQVYRRLPIQKAVAVNDYTVDLIFEEPQPLLFINLRGFLIPPVAIARDNRELGKTSIIGTGPYRFLEWKRGQYMKMAKFKGYWGKEPQIDDVEVVFRQEEGIRVAALQAGEMDLVLDIGQESGSVLPKVVRMPGPETVYLRIDEYIQKERGGVSIFADMRLRLALDYAIDRRALVALYKGFATPSMGQFASPGDFGFNPNLKGRPYDLEKARALVREAGAVGKTVKFVASSDRFAKCREVAEAVVFMLEQAGFKVNIMLMPQAEASKYNDVTGENRQYVPDIVLHSGDAFLETETRYDKFLVVGGKNTATRDPEPTRLYKEATAELNFTKRQVKLAQAWAYAYDQAHYVPLFKLEWMWGLAKNLEWKLDIAGRPFFADMRFTDR